MIPGVILAAGLSSRMGRPKALLPIAPGGPSFVAHLAGSLLAGGVADVIVIGRPDDEELAGEVERLGTRIRLVPNPHADLGQLSSLLAGLNAADHPGVHGVLVTPVDAPVVAASTVSRLISAFEARKVALVRATYAGKHGHPVIFGRAVFDALRRADPRVGAKEVVKAHAHEAIDVEVDDAGVVHDIDLPEDYARLLGEDVK